MEGVSVALLGTADGETLTRWFECLSDGGTVLDPEVVSQLLTGQRADGERLAVMLDRDTAFAAAVAHELAPVSVH